MFFPVLLAQAAQIKPIPVMLFRHIEHELIKVFGAFLAPTISNVIGTLQLTALVGCTLYILVMGLTIVFGADSSPFYTFIRTSLKIVIVAAFALSADGYLGGVVEALKGLETGLVEAMHQGGGSERGSIFHQLDLMLGEGFARSKVCFEHAYAEGVWSPGAALSWGLAALIFGIATAAIAVFGGAIVLLSKMALTILFALGPIFVLCLMFPQTEGFFHRWLGEVLSFTLQTVIVSVVLSFSMALFNSFVSESDLGNSSDANPFVSALQVAVVGFVMVYFLAKSGSVAGGLSGGMASSVVSAVGAAQMSASVGKGAVAGAKAAGGTAASVAKRAAALPKQALGAGMKAAAGVSKVAGYLAHSGKSSTQGSGSESTSGGSTSPSSDSKAGASSAVKSAVSNPLGTNGPSSSTHQQPLQRGGTRGVRAAAIANFGKKTAASPGRVQAMQSSPGVKPSSPVTAKLSQTGPSSPQTSDKKETP
jgi:type IV secretion system protein VirB6